MSDMVTIEVPRELLAIAAELLDAAEVAAVRRSPVAEATALWEAAIVLADALGLTRVDGEWQALP